MKHFLLVLISLFIISCSLKVYTPGKKAILYSDRYIGKGIHELKMITLPDTILILQNEYRLHLKRVIGHEYTLFIHGQNVTIQY